MRASRPRSVVSVNTKVWELAAVSGRALSDWLAW